MEYPQVAGTPDGSASIATNVTGSLGSVAGASNAETAIGISGMNLAPPGTSPGRGIADSPLNINRIRTLAGGRLAESTPDNGVPGLWSSCSLEAAQPRPQPTVEGASLLGVVVPSSQRSGLIMDFRPIDDAAVEPLIDQLLQQLENLGAGLSSLQGPTDLVVELLAMVVVLSAWAVVPRILDRSPEDERTPVNVATSLDGISGFPGSSSGEGP